MQIRKEKYKCKKGLNWKYHFHHLQKYSSKFYNTFSTKALTTIAWPTGKESYLVDYFLGNFPL